MKPIIRAENLGKKYLIRHEHPERYAAFRDVLARQLKKIFSFPKHLRTQPAAVDFEEFWALKDLNFDIYPGDRVGIIGRNGAGKSTLLKILSRITEPTTGRVELNGRVASLLEVGTGFHPELSGRENIFLNGAILGMSRAEIRRKFDEIVDFAGVEKFLDTPVKRYSSGMYVRLAFAVAAHLEPEILVVDEVLAVGDAEFQKKCLGKMEEVSSKEGRTILFVSHNLNNIRGLCERGILLNGGKLISNGSINETIERYLDYKNINSSSRFWENRKIPGNNIVKLREIHIVNKKKIPTDSHYITDDIGIEIDYEVLEEGHILWHGFNCYNIEGMNIFDSHSVTSKYYNVIHPIGRFRTIAWIPGNLLSEGTYLINVAIFNHNEHIIHLHVKDAVMFHVMEQSDPSVISARGNSLGQFPGIFRPLLKWDIEPYEQN